MSSTFRNGVILGLLLAVVVGTYLFRLWQADRQVSLHSLHLLHAIEERDAAKIAQFVDENYQDQWKQDRATLLTRLRELLRYTRNLRITPIAPLTESEGREGKWSARVAIEADPNELTVLIRERVNGLATPFILRWQRKSGKPWDWKLVSVSNESLELPAGEF